MKVGISQGNNLFSTSDVGLIILNSPVKGVKDFPELPPAGFADTLVAKTNLTVDRLRHSIPINSRVTTV